MKRCPRCRSTMLLDFGDAVEGYQRTWRCLGCGREVLHDVARRIEDEQLKERIRGEQMRVG